MDRNDALRAMYDAAGEAAKRSKEQIDNGNTMNAASFAGVAKTLSEAAQALNDAADV